MASVKFTKKNLPRIAFTLFSILLIPFSYYMGTIVGGISSLSPHYNSSKKILVVPPVARAPIAPPTGSALQQQTQTALTKFLEYLKKPNSSIGITLNDYKIQSMDTGYIKGEEIHAAFNFFALPADTVSKQSLIDKGGILQPNGWIQQKGYVILTKKNNSYTLREISFLQPSNF